MKWGIFLLTLLSSIPSLYGMKKGKNPIEKNKSHLKKELITHLESLNFSACTTEEKVLNKARNSLTSLYYNEKKSPAFHTINFVQSNELGRQLSLFIALEVIQFSRKKYKQMKTDSPICKTREIE